MRGSKIGPEPVPEPIKLFEDRLWCDAMELAAENRFYTWGDVSNNTDNHKM